MNFGKKFAFLFVFAFSFHAFAQQGKRLGELFFSLGSNIQINIDGKTAKNGNEYGFSAPTPICFAIGMGGNIFFKNRLSISPELVFSTNYYLWAKNRAFPAEIEHRTAQSFNLFLNVPCLYYWRVNSFYFSAGGGLGFNFRIVARANGVSAEEGDVDTKSISRELWDAANIIYPTIQANFDYLTSSNFSAGLGIRVHIPISCFSPSRTFFDSAIISILARFTLPSFKTKRNASRGK